MTIDEIRRRSLSLERAVAEAIEAFERDTGAKAEVVIERRARIYEDGRPKTPRIVVTVTARI